MYSHILALVVGALLIIVSVSMIFNRKKYFEIIDSLGESPALVYLVGILNTLFGLIILFSHAVFVIGWPVFVTIAGLLFLARGLLIMFVPNIIKLLSGIYKNIVLGVVVFQVILGILLILAGLEGKI